MAIEVVRAAIDPAVSVVVPSLPGNDRSRLEAALHAQDADAGFEALVVIDDSLDRCEARNRGIEAAAADVVAFTDDDCVPPRDWVASIRDAFRDDPGLILLEGPVTGGSRYRGTRHYVGCNLAADRSAALAVGGFRSAYAAWAEDTEFGWRMERDADGHCRFDPDVRMCHPSVPRTRIDRDAERRLRREYPDRYDAVIRSSWWKRLRRWTRARLPLEPALAAVTRLRRAPCDGLVTAVEASIPE